MSIKYLFKNFLLYKNSIKYLFCLIFILFCIFKYYGIKIMFTCLFILILMIKKHPEICNFNGADKWFIFILKKFRDFIFLWCLVFYNIDLNSVICYIIDNDIEKDDKEESEDEESFLQKYWMYIYGIAAGIILIYWFKTYWPPPADNSDIVNYNDFVNYNRSTPTPTDTVNDEDSDKFISMLDDLDKGYEYMHRHRNDNQE